MGFKDWLVTTVAGYDITDEGTAVARSILPPAREVFSVQPVEALNLVPVARCVSILETAMRQLDVEVYKNDIKVENAPAWIDYPDVMTGMTMNELVAKTTVELAVRGNAFWYVTRNPRGVSNVWLVPNWRMGVMTQPDMSITYQVDGNTVPNSDIVHLKLYHMPGEALGQGPLQRHQETLKAAKDLNTFFSNWFDNSAVPTGLLTTGSHINQDQATEIKKSFIDAQVKRTPAVLGYGMKYDLISLKPEEAQFLENQKYVARQIAVMFGIPSHWLGLANESTGLAYTNTMSDRRNLFEDGLQLYITRIEDALTSLLPRGLEAEFDLTEFLAPDLQTRYNSYKTAIEAGFMTVDEVRELEELPPLNGSNLGGTNE